ncbi:MAG: hypothetical protein A2458_02390 [Candidatus Kerfeldbacteria bacterium RIFOXYC2_FULL_38_9]|uniref:Uncharacterized protein n=1 Tax=Candidatus Kerfeldbacteria bacterium RIFOXYB2_FULL_38_14 TaxID=1798547 RepID=A0A1G2BHU9_9BACT|nr:MAG: hypothetical protein A2319_01515 [Candidatus Kerfeldbacteria bacterium RIFOXYB2_FULL_38_14]OGY88447.1 MAG: hypothetical protein A2458_02390 [Candidatus Kerfeldbacteria bacterium RIFOXYC2_FULL_38_9]
MSERHLIREQKFIQGQEKEEPPIVGHADVVDAFESAGYGLNSYLKGLLLEDKGTYDSRKGSGFTQATYHALKGDFGSVGMLFNEVICRKLRDKGKGIDVEKLATALQKLQHPDSRLFARLILQQFKPYQPKESDTILQSTSERIIIVGACMAAEMYYLEFVNNPGIYKCRGGDFGRMNVITDETGEPIMLEKEGLGDNFSCITLKETVLNGKQLPPGTLMAIVYPLTAAVAERMDFSREKFTSREIPLSQCKFTALRFSTLVADPKDRARAFGKHYDYQKDHPNVYPGFDQTTIQDLAQRARSMLK